MAMHSLTDYDLKNECFRHLAEENNILERAVSVLELIANSRTGLGEVLQGYASQACGGLRNITLASRNIVNAKPSKEDLEVISHANEVVKTVSKVLEMTPSAMKRNHADVLGKKERLSTEVVEQITYSFIHSPDVKFLLAFEDTDNNFIG